MYDIVGQATDTPVYELLGGAETDGTLEAYGSGGLGATVEERVEQVVWFENEDFSIAKLRGMPTTDRTLELVERAIEATGPGVTVAIDDTGAEGLGDVLDLVEKMNEYADDIVWFEDPAPTQQNLEASRQIREAVEFDVTGMEGCVGLYEFETPSTTTVSTSSIPTPRATATGTSTR